VAGGLQAVKAILAYHHLHHAIFWYRYEHAEIVPDVAKFRMEAGMTPWQCWDCGSNKQTVWAVYEPRNSFEPVYVDLIINF
jgi:hypothetical protein